MKTADLSYKDLGLFTAFCANTEEGKAAWLQIAEVTEGTGKVLTVQAKQFISKLRKAGYSVAKEKESHLSLEDIFNELND